MKNAPIFKEKNSIYLLKKGFFELFTNIKKVNRYHEKVKGGSAVVAGYWH